MNRLVEAIYKDGAVVLLEPLDVPDETRLQVIVAEQERDLIARARLADPLAKLPELAEDAGPADLAGNLDHYLYGLPKQL